MDVAEMAGNPSEQNTETEQQVSLQNSESATNHKKLIATACFVVLVIVAIVVIVMLMRRETEDDKHISVSEGMTDSRGNQWNANNIHIADANERQTESRDYGNI